MKQYLLFILLVLSSAVFSQNVVTVNTANTAGGEVAAGKTVILEPGFSFRATANSTFRAYIEPEMAIHEESTSVSRSKNYIVSVTPLDAALNATFENGRLDISENARALVNIQYYDGLGRPEQLVMRSITSNGADLISLTEYDAVGRANKQWLPTAKSGNNGAYFSPAEAKNNSMYGSYSYPYNETVYEKSPLNRIHKQFGSGNEWRSNGEKAVVTEYMSNTVSGALVCPWLEATSVGVRCQRDYAANELYITKVTDENGNVSYTFTNKQGQILMTQQGDARTGYAYDDFGNLAYVLPPLAMSELSKSNNHILDTSDRLKDYAYLYKYDERNRCIEKKLPGADWIYYVYDKADRLILSQDGNQRAEDNKKWTFYKYDVHGRLIISGIFYANANHNHSSLRNWLKNEIVTETPQHESNLDDKAGYTNNHFSNVPFKNILLINYYDTYRLSMNFLEQEAFDIRAISTKGLLTGTRAKLLDGTGNETATTYHYDNYGRVLQKSTTSTVLKNKFWSGSDNKWLYANHYPHWIHEFYKYSFTGNLLNKKTMYSLDYSSLPYLVENHRYEYDHADRPTKTWHKIGDLGDNNSEVLMSELAYDDWGRVQEKKVHRGLETTNYNYNVRSWLEEIRSESNRFFQEMTYDYNGNIASMNSGNDHDNDERGYEFTYDNFNRMTAANYLRNGYPTGAYDGFSESVSYDLNGNITSIFRKGAEEGMALGLVERYTMDDLAFDYKGNQVTKITENAPHRSYSYRSQEYKPDYNEVSYFYDQNGNMNIDLNKGIAKIKYNFLNLPDSILFSKGGHLMENTYDASGKKLAVEYKTGVGDVNVPLNTTTTASDWTFAHTEVEHYLDNLRYTAEGNNITSMRLLTNEGYAERENGTWKYYYNLTDHLGSVRYTFGENGTNVGFTHYYPFGMEFIQYNDIPGVPGKEKYTGKELIADFGLNLYDYIWRYYDKATGRFTTMDPLAEMYYSVSPYVYVLNNPINAIDPDGRIVIFINGMHTGTGGTYKYWGDNGAFASAAMKYLNDYRAIYRDGSVGGWSNIHKNNSADYRMSEGRKQGKLDAVGIVRSISDNDGNLIETIKIITHSMGGAYAKGYVESFLEYFKNNNISTDFIEFEADFAPYQPTKQKANPKVNTYQFSHSNDRVAGDDKMEGATYMNTSSDKKQDHGINTFMDQIKNLPTGKYKVENGKIISQ